MGQPRRRVSYVIPFPTEPVPRLQLPPRGSILLGSANPTLIYIPSSAPKDSRTYDDAYQHPRHRLGLASLALDGTTLLTGRSAPEGILYSGGRDGMVISWDLGIPMKKRSSPSPSSGSDVREGPLQYGTKHHWELITGWLDDSIDEEGSDTEGPLPVGSDGDVLGDVTSSLDRRGKHIGDLKSRDREQLEKEKEWVPDVGAFKPGTPSTFRQCAQAHTDWVNDILLCNFNQTLVSASSDGTVKAWSPHVIENVDPAPVGRHADYVRCLTACPTQNWVASGSFDRTIKLWDLSRSAPSTPTSSSSSSDPAPLITLSPPDSAGPKSSIYALSTDRYGTTIASGSPERVVRLWDPRAGRRTGKLVGHTDNIRAVQVSEDGRYLLTGSADASIKLWSLNTLRCLHTFTHHAESVWSLASTHPSLEVFYSGDRSGLLCRVDVEDCASVSEGECVVLCREGDSIGPGGEVTEKAEGINKIITMDDQLVWTASGTASIRRWRVPPKRMVRVANGDREWTDKGAIVVSDSPVATPTISPPSSGGRHRNKGSMSLSRDTLSPPGFGPVGSAHSLSPSYVDHVDHDAPQAHTSRPISRSFSGGSAYELGKVTQSGLYGIPVDSLVRLVAPDYPPLGSATSAYFNRPRDPEVSTMYSAASVMSIPHVTKPRPDGRLPLAGLFPVSATNSGQSSGSAVSPHARSGSEDMGMLLAVPGQVLVPYEERELALDAIPLVSEPDYIIAGSPGLVRSIILNTRVHALTVDTAGEVAVWDIVRCMCLGRFERAEVAAASHSGSSAGGTGEHERSPRELLELVRERIEGEAVVSAWCMADTKTGVLTVHMTERAFEAEVYADEVGFVGDARFTDESKLNIGKWVLKNLFWGFVKEEQRNQRKAGIGASPGTARNSTDNVLPPSLGRGSHHHDDHHHHSSHRHHRERSSDVHHAHHHQHHSHKPSRKSSSSSPESTRKAYRMAATASTSSIVVSAPHIIRAVPPPFQIMPAPAPPIVTPSLIPLYPNAGNADVTNSIPQSLITPAEATPTPTAHHHIRARSATLETPLPLATPTVPISAKEPPADYFSARRGSLVPSTPDDFSGWGGPGSAGGREPQTPNTPGGLMGRLKSFSKMTSKRPTGDVPQTPTIGVMNTPILETPVVTAEPTQTPSQTPLQALLATPFTPANTSEAPHIQLPPSTTIIIGEDSFPSFITLYRGSTSLIQYDTTKLEEAMPTWLLEYLLLNKLPAHTPLAKLSFVLLPWKGSDGELLPELLDTQQSKLTASRYLRVRKLVAHVQEKLDKPSTNPPTSRTPSIRSSVDVAQHLNVPAIHPRSKPEDTYEILCNEVLLPLDMSLAAVRQYVWRQSTELVMHYRRKQPAVTVA